ncbi:MAG: TetR family transcriptional regulator [Solirubrobacterales bacterium]
MSAEATKTRILDAAFREFSEHGLAGGRVDRIAKHAKCNKNLIYIYFESKEGLFATVLEERLAGVYAGTPFDVGDLPAAAGRIFDFSHQNPDVYRLLMWATLEGHAALPLVRRQEHDRKIPLIEAEQKAGTIDLDVPPEMILMAVTALATAWSSAFPFGVMANPDSKLSEETIREAVAEMVARITGQAP